MESLNRRRWLSVLGIGGVMSLSGCLGGGDASDNNGTETPKAKTPEEFRSMLPEYDGTPASEDEYFQRATEINSVIQEALFGHDWIWASGVQNTSEGRDKIVVSVTDRGRARDFLPEEWGNIRIGLEVGTPNVGEV